MVNNHLKIPCALFWFLCLFLSFYLAFFYFIRFMDNCDCAFCRQNAIPWRKRNYAVSIMRVSILLTFCCAKIHFCATKCSTKCATLFLHRNTNTIVAMQKCIWCKNVFSAKMYFCLHFVNKMFSNTINTFFYKMFTNTAFYYIRCEILF